MSKNYRRFHRFKMISQMKPMNRVVDVQIMNLQALRQHLFERTVEDNGFEPLTPCVQGRCSSQLS